MKKKCVIIFTEGETEEEFYNVLLDEIKKRYHMQKFSINKLEKRCLKGITKFDNKLLNIYKNDLKIKYKDYEKIIFLCYDTDVFEFTQKPSINWKEVEEKLYELGVNKIYHLSADKCIEDWFLLDIEGILNYLNIKKPKKIIGKNGVEKLEFLFNKGNRLYQKGFATKGFIESLDCSLILDKQYDVFKPLIECLTTNSILV